LRLRLAECRSLSRPMSTLGRATSDRHSDELRRSPVPSLLGLESQKKIALYQLLHMESFEYWSTWLKQAMKNVPVAIFVGCLLAYITWNISSLLFRGLALSTAVTVAYLYLRNSTASEATMSKLKSKVSNIRSSLFAEKFRVIGKLSHLFWYSRVYAMTAAGSFSPSSKCFL